MRWLPRVKYSFFYVCRKNCILWTVIAVVSADCIIKCKQVLAREALVSRGTLVVTEGL